MGDVWFYHLLETPAEAALPRLIGQATGKGWRIELRGSDMQRMERLDQALWLGPEDGFLPHGLAGGPHDALQPVLLTVAGQEGAGLAAANAPECLMAVDGAAVTPEEAARLTRTCVVFDGGDGDQLARARDLWRVMTGAGLAAQYWAQEGGRWVKKQERPARPDESGI